MKFKGDNAWWFVLIIIGYNCLPLFMFQSIKFNPIIVITFAIYYAFDLIMIPITLRNEIELYDDCFVFTYGFSKVTIALKDILKIKKTKSIIASSANSLNRILIQTKHNELIVALKENDRFINEVNQRMKQLEV